MGEQPGFDFDFPSAEIVRLPSGKRRSSSRHNDGSITVFPPARRKAYVDQVAREILALPDEGDARAVTWQSQIYALSDYLREHSVTREEIRPLLLDFKLAVQARIHQLAAERFCRPRSA